jgi:uncharacterized protein
MSYNNTLTKLKEWFEGKSGVLVAFSGGLDSTLVAAAAHMALGKRAMAVTVRTEFISKREVEEATKVARSLGIDHKTIDLHLKNLVMGNPPDRCYICKRQIMISLKKIASKIGFDTVVDGTNYDDLGLDRPGLKALKEEGIMSPLAELKIGKAQIRKLSKALGLNYTKTANPCLATRFPVGYKITTHDLELVDTAEEFIRKMGFKVVRVRVSDSTAKIEVGRKELPKLRKGHKLERIINKLKGLGFLTVSLKPEGYETSTINR